MISWILDKDGWLQSYSTVNQSTSKKAMTIDNLNNMLLGMLARHQNQFYTSPGGSEGSLVRACLPPGLETWNIQRIRVFVRSFDSVGLLES